MGVPLKCWFFILIWTLAEKILLLNYITLKQGIESRLGLQGSKKKKKVFGLHNKLIVCTEL